MVFYGNATFVVDLATGAWQMTDWGHATHLGLWTDTASGQLALTPAQTGHGTTVAADGSTIEWVMSGVTTTITGGTGRFQGATGGTTLTITSQQPPVFNRDGTMTVQLTYKAVGQITY